MSRESVEANVCRYLAEGMIAVEYADAETHLIAVRRVAPRRRA